jgi:hypothetical protein
VSLLEQVVQLREQTVAEDVSTVADQLMVNVRNTSSLISLSSLVLSDRQARQGSNNENI